MSLLAALKNKTQPLATAIPAIRATRKAETGGGIAGIARIAVAAGQNEKDESANDKHTSLAKTTKEQSDKFEPALAALAACGWIGVSAENVARAIADGMTDEAQLVALLEGET
jgi:hypothetical protein